MLAVMFAALMVYLMRGMRSSTTTSAQICYRVYPSKGNVSMTPLSYLNLVCLDSVAWGLFKQVPLNFSLGLALILFHVAWLHQPYMIVMTPSCPRTTRKATASSAPLMWAQRC